MKNIINICAATLHLSTVRHPDIINNCVYNTAFGPHRSLLPVYRKHFKNRSEQQHAQQQYLSNLFDK